MADAKILATIKRTDTEQLQISVSEYKGNSYLNLRIFYTTDEGETWLPTKKGVTFSPDQLDILCDAIEESPIKEKESISIKIDVELLDKLRGLAQIKNKTVLELIELTIENATKNVETKYPNYKEEAEIYKKRFENSFS